MERHVPEEDIACAVAGVISPAETAEIEAHLAACAPCAQVAAFYRGIVEVLRLPGSGEQARPELHDRLRQGVRLRRFLDRLLTEPGWLAEVRRDPRSALERFQIQPTPQLVAALAEIGDLPQEHDRSQIDERVNKLWLGL